MAKTLYDYWFVQFDFPDENGKPYKSSGGKMIWNEVLKREIPVGWEAKTLVEIANITMGQSPSGESFNESQEGMIFFQGSTDFGWRYPENRIFTNAPTRYAFEDDILLSVRAPIGAINIALSNCCIGRGLAAINSKEGFNSFLIYQMNNFKKKFDYLNSVGTTFGSLTKDELHNLELACPQINILQKFEAKVQILDKKIKKNTQQNQQLSSLRDWLLPMLMNGQVKVE
jgi:type I restriction enzyme S subunit